MNTTINPSGRAAVAGPASGTVAAMPAALFDRDKFLVHQKRLSLSEKYNVFDAQGRPLLFVRREAHLLRILLGLVAAVVTFLVIGVAGIAIQDVLGSGSSSRTMTNLDAFILITALVCAVAGAIAVAVVTQPKRHISVCSDEGLRHEVMRIFQDRKWQIPIATYTVADADLNMLGWCRKNYLYNLFRKQWECYRPDGQLICVAMEDSVALSILRRLLGPMLGILRTNFVLLAPDHSTKLGEFNRKFTLFDKYVLDLSADESRTLDRRLAVAIGVLLDTGERR